MNEPAFETSVNMAGPASSSGSPLLSVRDVSVRFGGIVALDGVTFDVTSGQIAGLIGPNGAGKTTLFNVITRVYRPDGGQVVFDGTNLLRTAPHKIVRRGIARTFQNVELFPGMSVLENVLVGTHARVRWFAERRARRRAQEALEEVGAGDLAGRADLASGEHRGSPSRSVRQR